ncbi:MAG: HD domain-containing protein [Ruminococcus sp.]|nr:HD domain-containing protein [Ruminococcus sp.]
MIIGEPCRSVLRRLEEAGERAYLVGGSVRDGLLGEPVHDLDITTSARPERVMEVLSDLSPEPTGISHGTVTVTVEGIKAEITTFRIDGCYSDSRRPDSVVFTDSLEEDLARRDFTMNAVAMDLRGNITDPFGGASDIEKGIIRCVGDPRRRFTEDALRMMRAVRFASQLGFTIEEETRSALMELSSRLSLVSRERLREELDRLLLGKNLVSVMLGCREVMAQVIPELRPCFDFDQHSRYHRYTVYEHIVRAVAAAPKDLLLRRIMLLHDIGKPPMFTLDNAGEGHFKGHAPLSADMARQIMGRFGFDSATIGRTCRLIAHHSDKIRDLPRLKRLLAELGLEELLLLMEVKKADNSAKNQFVMAENAYFDKLGETARQLIADRACIDLKGLAVNGSDLNAAGLSGREVGQALSLLLDRVIDGELPNQREALLSYIKEVRK